MRDEKYELDGHVFILSVRNASTGPGGSTAVSIQSKSSSATAAPANVFLECFAVQLVRIELFASDGPAAAAAAGAGAEWNVFRAATASDVQFSSKHELRHEPSGPRCWRYALVTKKARKQGLLTCLDCCSVSAVSCWGTTLSAWLSDEACFHACKSLFSTINQSMCC